MADMSNVDRDSSPKPLTKISRRDFLRIGMVAGAGTVLAACEAVQKKITPVAQFIDTATPKASATEKASATPQPAASATAAKVIETATPVPTASLGAVEVLGAGDSTPLGIVDQASLQTITEKMGAGVTVYLEADKPSGTIAQAGNDYQGTISQVPKELMVKGIKYALQLSNTPSKTPGINYLSTDGKNTSLTLDNQWGGSGLNAAVKTVFLYQTTDKPDEVLAAIALNNGEVVKGNSNKVREGQATAEATAVTEFTNAQLSEILSHKDEHGYFNDPHWVEALQQITAPLGGKDALTWIKNINTLAKPNFDNDAWLKVKGKSRNFGGYTPVKFDTPGVYYNADGVTPVGFVGNIEGLVKGMDTKLGGIDNNYGGMLVSFSKDDMVHTLVFAPDSFGINNISFFDANKQKYVPDRDIQNMMNLYKSIGDILLNKPCYVIATGRGMIPILHEIVMASQVQAITGVDLKELKDRYGVSTHIRE